VTERTSRGRSACRRGCDHDRRRRVGWGRCARARGKPPRDRRPRGRPAAVLAERVRPDRLQASSLAEWHESRPECGRDR